MIWKMGLTPVTWKGDRNRDSVIAYSFGRAPNLALKGGSLMS